MAAQGLVSLSVATTPRVGALLRHVLNWIGRETQIEGERLFNLQVAVGEAISNVLRHAYAGDADGNIEIDVRREGVTLVVSIGDHGTWIDRRPPDDMLSSEEGRGIALMRALVDSVEIERAADGTTVHLRISP